MKRWKKIPHAWGYEVALPMTWHLGSSRTWDFQFEPYLLKKDINNRGQTLGARFLAGYRF